MSFVDQKARDTARTRLDRNIVVEAGAGTGKTKLLIDRLLHQLLGADDGSAADITRVVALTFTKKAAGEIKVRLQKELSALKTEAAEKALRDLDRAPIGTIHSFAAQILQLYPLEAGVDPGFAVDEGPAGEELFAAEWALWLDVELGEDAPREDAWAEVLRHASLEDLEALALGLCRAKAQPKAKGKALSELLKKSAAEAEGLPKGLAEPRGKIKEVLSEIARHLKATAAATADGVEPLPPLRSFASFSNASWPKTWPEAGNAVYERVRGLAEKTGPFEQRLVAKAAALLEPFVERFQDVYARRGHVSFDGLLLKTRDLLRDHPRVREELKGAYAAVLVDEFQDTDPLQGEILLYLCEKKGAPAKTWQDVKLEAGKLFVVGDPKQSIYRFRGADIAAYERFIALMIEQGAELCRLQTNFRSTEAILAPVNALFEKVMLARAGSQPAYVAIEPAKAGGPKEGVELLKVESADGHALSSGDGRDAEAEAIAGWIAEHCGAGKRPYKDAAILLRSTTPLPAYLAPLKRLGIPYVVEGEKYFYGTQEVLDFLNLLRAVDDPFDAVSLVGLLRSPLVGLTDAAIMRLSEAGALSWKKAASVPADLPGRARVVSFYERLAGYNAKVGRLPLGALVRSILSDSFLIELASFAYHREQTLSNLMKFSRLAVAAGDERGLSLKEFAQETAESVETAQEEGESPLADEHLDAVRLLTIHKAKGLEYPVVFLPNLSAKRGGGGEKPAVRVDWSSGEAGLRLKTAKAADAAMAFIEIQEEEREKDEEARLFYVAMTRARERLILLMNAKFDSGAPFANLLQSSGVLEPKTITPSGVLSPGPSLVNKRGEVGFEPTALAKGWEKRSKAFATANAVPAFVNPAAAAEAQAKRAPTALDLDAVARRATAALVGSVCHFVLERWDYKGKAKLNAALAVAGKALEADAKVLAEAHEVLESFLDSTVARDLGKAEILARELPLLFARKEGVVRGAIDLLYKEGGKLVLADYKTEKVARKDVVEAAKRYAPQLALYAEAVQRALNEKPVTKVVFLRAGAAVTL